MFLQIFSPVLAAIVVARLLDWTLAAAIKTYIQKRNLKALNKLVDE